MLNLGDPAIQNNLGIDCNELNNRDELDFSLPYNRLYTDANLDDNPYSNVIIDSKFYTVDSLCNLPQATEFPIYISINPTLAFIGWWRPDSL